LIFLRREGHEKKKCPRESAYSIEKAGFSKGKQSVSLWFSLAGLGWIWPDLGKLGSAWKNQMGVILTLPRMGR
jgi:hypothetical protein